MKEQQTTIQIDDIVFMPCIMELYHDGYRLVQMCATKTADGFELSYSFALEYSFINLRYNISENTEIVSISSIFPPAFLYENEMKDLFGVKIKLISLDYEGKFYRTSIKTPMNPKKEESESSGDEPASSNLKSDVGI